MQREDTHPHRHWHALLPFLVGLAALILYLATAAPSIVELYDDSLEFQLVGPILGIAHPTGYPLYTLLSGLWSRVLFPFGNWAWRINLLSALTGAGAVVLVFLLARGLARGNFWAGLAAAIAFTLCPIWWRQTTLAEVYALHGLFVAAILYTTVRIGTAVQRRSPSHIMHSSRHLTTLALLVGLSFTHHRTTLLLLPGLVLYLLWTVPDLWRPRRAWIGWTLALLLPLLLYVYIPMRAAMGAVDLEGDYINTWIGFWNHVLAHSYTGFFAQNPLAVDRPLASWLMLFLAQFGWIGLILGTLGVGAGLLEPYRRPEWMLILITLAVNFTFATIYRVADAQVFALPAFLCFALGIGNGVTRLSSQKRPATPLLLCLLLLLFPFGRGPAVDRSRDWAVHDYAVAMAKVDFPPGSVVVGLRGQTTALAYMQRAEGLGQGATPVAIDDPEKRRDFVAESMISGIPVYLTQELAGIEDRYSFSGEGPLVRVWPRGAAEPGAPAVSQVHTVADGLLHLTGYDLDVLAQAGGPALRVAFYWQPVRTVDRILKLSLRLIDANGAILAQEDPFPLHQVALTPHWLPGEIVRDVHYLSLPAAARRLLVVVYDAETVAEVGQFVLELP